MSYESHFWHRAHGTVNQEILQHIEKETVMIGKFIHKADGSRVNLENKEMTLEDAQKAVGGYITPINVMGKALLVNEEGLLLKLPRNDWATEVVGRLIVGDVLEIKKGSMS